MEIVAGSIRVRLVGPITLTVLVGPVMVKSIQVTKGSGPLDLALGDNQFTTIHLQGLDAMNEAGKFQRAPKWSVGDGTIVQITPAEDGLSCRVEAATPVHLGSTTISVVDQDDSTVPPISFNVTVGGEQITHFGATIDPPAEKNSAPAPAGGGTNPSNQQGPNPGGTNPILPNANNPDAPGGGANSPQGSGGTSGPHSVQVDGGGTVAKGTGNPTQEPSAPGTGGSAGRSGGSATTNF